MSHENSVSQGVRSSQPAKGCLRPQTNACRTAVDLSGLWTLRFGRGNWQDGIPDGIPVGVPGSWNDQLPGARDEFGPAWYERRFEAPPLTGREAAFRFGSVCYAAQVWLNGKWLGGHEGGHLPFAVPCTNALADGENVLVVRVDGRLGRDRVPPGLVPPTQTHGRIFHPDTAFDFFPHAGIHRRTELVITPRDGIRDLRVDTVRDGDGAVFSVTADAGDGDIAISLDGEPIASPHRVGSADLWSPASPRLHLLEADLYRGGVLVDRYVPRCGIRTLDVTGDKLLLNGAPVRLRGFARHEDFPARPRRHAGQPASAALTLAMSKGPGPAGSSSFQYSTGLSPLKDRHRGTASYGARRDEPVRVTSWTQPAPKSYSYRTGLRALAGKASRRRTASSLAVSSRSKNGSL
jgi:beta-glucuronidase